MRCHSQVDHAQHLVVAWRATASTDMAPSGAAVDVSATRDSVELRCGLRSAAAARDGHVVVPRLRDAGPAAAAALALLRHRVHQRRCRDACLGGGWVLSWSVGRCSGRRAFPLGPLRERAARAPPGSGREFGRLRRSRQALVFESVACAMLRAARAALRRLSQRRPPRRGGLHLRGCCGAADRAGPSGAPACRVCAPRGARFLPPSRGP